MVTSFDNFNLRWKHVSSTIEANCVTYEYECDLPNQFQPRKYHMTKVVSPQSESISYSII